MILIASSAPSAGTSLKKISTSCGKQGQLAKTARELTSALKERQYDVIVVDQVFADLNPNVGANLARQNSGATILFINFALAGVERIIEECRVALDRRQKEHVSAMEHARRTLRSDLTSPVTGILLSSELALADPELPTSVRSKIQSVRELALEMKNRLDIGA